MIGTAMRAHALAVFAWSTDKPAPPISRDDAQHAARFELSKPPYHRDDPSIAQRVIRWIWHRISDALSSAIEHSPGKGIGLFVIVLLIAVIVAVVAVRVGRVRKTIGATESIVGDTSRTADDHRRLARSFAANERWADAVREWLRATTRELEERGVLDPRPGRTAAELCAEVSVALPGVARDLRLAAALFEKTWYGNKIATSEDERVLRELDSRVAGSHRKLVSAL